MLDLTELGGIHYLGTLTDAPGLPDEFQPDNPESLQDRLGDVDPGLPRHRLARGTVGYRIATCTFEPETFRKFRCTYEGA